MKNLMILLIVLATVALTGFVLFNNKKAANEKIYRNDPDKKVLVTVDSAAVRELSKKTEWLGAFEPNREMTVASETLGKIVWSGAKEGDLIAAGSAIAKLDDAALRLQLKAAETAWENAKNDVAHYTALVKGDAVPQMQLDKALLQAASTESQVMLLRDQIGRCVIRAGIGGIVTKKMFEPGTVVSPGAPLLQLTDISTLKLTIGVPESEIFKIKTGQSIEVGSEVHPGIAFRGTVSLIGSKGDNAHNFPVQILVSNSAKNPLKAGMYGSVTLGENLSAGALTIPKEALIGSTKDPQVYVVQDGKAVLKNIRVGVSDSRFCEVLSGLEAGAPVVVSGQINLKDGTPVSVFK
jgi:RND family efflux transporter MFP subunit